MTIAIDRKSGAVVGQVVPTWHKPLIEWPRANDLRLLTKDGYRDVPRDSVRLEQVSDR